MESKCGLYGVNYPETEGKLSGTSVEFVIAQGKNILAICHSMPEVNTVLPAIQRAGVIAPMLYRRTIECMLIT